MVNRWYRWFICVLLCILHIVPYAQKFGKPSSIFVLYLILLFMRYDSDLHVSRVGPRGAITYAVVSDAHFTSRSGIVSSHHRYTLPFLCHYHWPKILLVPLCAVGWYHCVTQVDAKRFSQPMEPFLYKVRVLSRLAYDFSVCNTHNNQIHNENARCRMLFTKCELRIVDSVLVFQCIINNNIIKAIT